MGVATDTRAGRHEMLTGFGRTLRSRSTVLGPVSTDRLQELVAARPATGLLARGSGLSYGDAAQNAGGIVLAPVTGSGIELDTRRGTVTATASTTFREILERTVPAGFVLPVLPGTARLTVGGAIAADVHGKNHPRDGSLSAWVEEIELVDGTGEVRKLTPGDDPGGLRATIGGMGLTGIIRSATIRLLPVDGDIMAVTSVRAGCLEELLTLLEVGKSRYAVAWIDATATGRALGRGIVELADHAAGSAVPGEPPAYRAGRVRRAPALPVSLVTPLSAGAFNALWFRKAPARHTGPQDLATFFHRLDAVQGWNKAVGPHGLIQYQFVVPGNAERVIAEVLEAVQRSGCAPFLGTVKRFGAARGGELSFCSPGWCLAIDMPAGRPRLASVLQFLDLRVAEAGGRVYLAKDARLPRGTFHAMYPDLTSWRDARARLDPHGLFRSDLGRRVGLC